MVEQALLRRKYSTTLPYPKVLVACLIQQIIIKPEGGCILETMRQNSCNYLVLQTLQLHVLCLSVSTYTQFRMVWCAHLQAWNLGRSLSPRIRKIFEL